MGSADTERMYMCIDLKSFYASVECADLGVDPFTTPLVVADNSRGKGAITLAISPALKKLGVKNRSRLFQIPSHIEYITVKPHMKRYMQASAQIYGTLLNYISPEDIHVYSIDEYFIDITPYTNLYKKTPRQLAQLLLDAVLDATHIYATVGIGTNLFLAKIALDILAKHAPDFIGYLDESLFKEQIWHHQPITDIWQIGSGIANRLRKFGAFDLHGITQVPEHKLYKEFGVNAELLIDHAWGRESCTIADIHAYRPSKHSLSQSQILLRNYTADEARLPMREMVESLVLELLQIKAVTKCIHVHIGYAAEDVKSTGGSRTLVHYTDSFQELCPAVLALFDKYKRPHELVRRIAVSFEELVNKAAVPTEIDLFSNALTEAAEQEEHIQKTMLNIKGRFGKNAILRASSLQEEGTMQFRNTLVGGHNGE